MLTLLILGGLLPLQPGVESPQDCGDWCENPGIGLSRQRVLELAEQYPPENSGPPESPTHWYVYARPMDCPGNSPENPDEVACDFAMNYCEENVPDSSGPRTVVYRQAHDESGAIGSWGRIDPTCYTAQVPPRSGQAPEGVTIEMIVEHFNLTPFSIPQLAMQPPDDRTLVRLPVYYQANFPEEGFEPGEIETVTLVGDEVRIRPTLETLSYDFGDGAVLTDTVSLGGPYPSGDVSHAYESAGAYTASLQITFGGEYSINGGPWLTVPAEQTLDAGSRDLQVFTSVNRLTGDD